MSDNPPNSVFIPLSKTAPHSLRVRLPRGAKIIGYGTFKLPPSGRKIMLLIDRRPSQDPFKREGYDYLEVYLRVKSSDQLRWRRLNSVPATGFYDVQLSKVWLWWLQPNLRRGPIIVVRSIVDAQGTDSMLIFPHGFEGEVRSQGFFSFFANLSQSSSMTFSGVDERGFLRGYWSQDLSHGMDERGIESGYWIWNGSAFVEEKKPQPEEQPTPQPTATAEPTPQPTVSNQ
jgi:hypothetical protein